MARRIPTDIYGHPIKPPTIAQIAAEGRPMDISCSHPDCRRARRLTPAQAVQLLGPNCTIEQADRRLRCSACGSRGRDGFIRARFEPPLVGRS